MFWLERPPWAKWLAVAAFSLFALWMEIKPEPVVEHPFATIDIEVGEPIGSHNTQLLPVPEGLLEPPAPGSHALSPIPSGSPVLAGLTGGKETVIPSGWWIVAMEVPEQAAVGDRVKIVLLDGGELIDGVVSSSGFSDGLDFVMGGVAIAPESAPRVASAAIDGRVSVLLPTS